MPPQQAPSEGQPQTTYQPQPVTTPQQPGTPPMPQPQFTAQPQPVAPVPKRRSKVWIVILAVVAALVALGVGLYMAFGRSSLPKTDTTVINAVSAAPSAADIAALDKTEAFWGYFKNAAEQQKLVMTKVEAVIANDQDPATAHYYYIKAGMDYTTRKFTVAKEEQENGEVEAQLRCYDGNSYIPRGSVDSWSKIDSSDPLAECNIDVRPDKFSDGVNASGLSPKQSQAFVGTLRAQEGLMTVQNLELVDHKGKPYLHFTVQLTPTPGPSGMVRFGGGWLMMAFRKTGLDATTHPYDYPAADSRGFRFEYYVDPTTKLPAYSEVHLDRIEANAAASTYIYKNRYQFGTATFDASINNNAPLVLDW